MAKAVKNEAVDRFIELMRDLVERAQVKKSVFDAVELSAKLSYGSVRDSDAEYEHMVARIKEVLTKD
jgi:hypothetical protein